MSLQNPTDTPQWRARAKYLPDWKQLGLYTGDNLAQAMQRGLKEHAATRAVFVVEGHVEETTALEMWQKSAGIAAALAARGLCAGDVIVNQLPSCPQGMLVFLAAMRLGLVLVPVVHIYGPAELSYILRSTRAKALVLPSRWRNIDFAARVTAMGELQDLEMIIGVGDGTLPGPSMAWRELEAFDGPELALTEADANAICMINFTSGTTAAPKGVMHSHNSLIATAIRCPPLQTDIRDGWGLRFGPAGHIGAIQMLARAWLLGDEVVHMDHYDPGFVAEICDRFQVRRSGGVPTHWMGILDACNGRLPGAIATLLTGATSVPPALMQRLDDQGARPVRSWGCTEVPSLTSGEPTEPLAKRMYTDGRPVPGSIVLAVDDQGREVPPGQPGELIAMGPQMFLGYLDGSLDEAAFTPEGFYRTGDIGVFDADGYVTLVDRKKDIVLRGGENISSREVEELLMRHPAVFEAAVVGWPDERLGERVGAFVQVRPGQSVTLDEVRTLFAEAGVARQKTPEHLVIVSELPRTAAGKIVKNELRKRVREGLANSPVD